jgi:hypothetical protein
LPVPANCMNFCVNASHSSTSNCIVSAIVSIVHSDSTHGACANLHRREGHHIPRHQHVRRVQHALGILVSPALKELAAHRPRISLRGLEHGDCVVADVVCDDESAGLVGWLVGDCFGSKSENVLLEK